MYNYPLFLLASEHIDAWNVEDLLMQSAFKLKTKWLSVKGQTQMFVGAINQSSEFDWISTSNLEPTNKAETALDKDIRMLH